MSGDVSGDGGVAGPSINKVLSALKMGGKMVAGPMLQSMIREQVVVLLRKHDPEVLKRYITVNYPLVHEEMPQNYKNALANVGPQFEDEIQQMVRPQQIMAWLQNPDEWFDVDEHPEKAEDVKRCHEVITETPGGQQWLEEQCIAVYQIAGIL